MTQAVGLLLAVIGACGLWWAGMEHGRIIRRNRLVDRARRM